MSDSGSDFDAVVVGAGAAGLAATHRLHHAGRRVVCLEASDRIGGRCHTDLSIFGVPFDIGGHWLHHADVNAFVPIGRSLGFDVYDAPTDTYLESDLSRDDVNAVLDDVDAKLTAKVAAEADMAMSDAFTPKDDVERAALFLRALSAGRDLDEISMHEWVTADLEENNCYCREGFGAIVARHARGLPVTLNTPVRAVTRTTRGVEVETSEGKITADHAIVTVSVGVLAAEAIRFDPPLEAARWAALDVVTMGTYNHCAMLFADGSLPVGPDAWVAYPVAALSGDVARAGGMLCNISWSGLCIFDHVGRFARELEAAGQDAAIAFALERMRDVFGSDIVKGFRKGYATRWASNEHTRGSYSGTLPGGAGRRGALRRPHAEVIHFAGEAMSEGETVTVSGAHKEGLRAAGEVLGRL
ncbi:MAG: FAD-dependent oxidoreductase [Pseudomonadota bacterium]